MLSFNSVNIYLVIVPAINKGENNTLKKLYSKKLICK